MSDETQTVRANVLLFHCRIDGPEGAPWLVFSNSLVTDLSVWDAQVAAFAGRYRTLRYDQRGHGGTEVPAEPANFEVLANDAAALMDHFGIRGAVVAGVSMGAATALLLAARRPDLVSAVVASDGQAATAPGGAQAWQDRIDLAREKGMEAFADATVKRWFSPASVSAAHPAIPRVRRMIATTAEPGFVACARALQSYDLRAELPALRQPVLLIAGETDGAMPATMRAMATSIPDARFVEISAAGHLPCIEAPGPFNAAVEAFLAEKVPRIEFASPDDPTAKAVPEA
ncbi:alpha/beta fold hydrolase [Pararoseomonas indoligenes]|uniref:Alpha/beta fold hydrolase n=1 Tax=Roseomonas indoligenes TaxID=2820811 RepID=A0A940MVQ3_9PROT|nr:alpha/beta fold hydrolase [Pararoseomonas indoligenes]MBP0492578.1 alpha/beta fold hydrolase [Pararoseomonas indoligenes]